jgi:hypothetical protein
VFISYGKQSNDRLLQYYGFVDSENPYDLYDFGVGFLDLIIKYADEIGEEVAVPTTPSPRDRLQAVAAALSATEVEDSVAGAKKKTSKATGDEYNTRYFRTARSALTAKEGKETSVARSNMGPLRVLDHFDDITVRAMRALYSNPEEWSSLTRASGGQLQTLETLGQPLSSETENKVATALRAIAKLELASKATSLDDDVKLFEEMRQSKTSSPSDTGAKAKTKGFGATNEAAEGKAVDGGRDDAPVDPSGRFGDADFAVVSFRIEKKRLLKEASKML